jgi:phosphatidylglycerophosphatase A
MPIVVKESSDELNPPVITTGEIAGRKAPRRTLVNYLALAFSTCGVGYAPLAPGTWGSLLGVCIYGLFNAAYASWPRLAPPGGAGISAAGAVENLSQGVLRAAQLRTLILLVFVLVLTWVGIWAAARTEKLLGRKDPGIVVVDEVVGQLIAFLFVPFNSGWWVIVGGFVSFRVFDIWKPYPIRRLEMLESGLGIMADDVLAGVYAAILMSLLVSIYSLL